MNSAGRETLDQVSRQVPDSLPDADPRGIDFAGLPGEAGSVRARVSKTSQAMRILLGWGALVTGGVVGGSLWSWIQRDPGLLFLPMSAAYAGFLFWLWTPLGYRADQGALYILRPRGPLAVPRRNIVAGLASPALIEALAARTGAAWIRSIPIASQPPAGARLLWIDPELEIDPELGPPPGDLIGGAQVDAGPWAVPLGGAILPWGGWTGNFWSPREGLHRRYSRCARPRLGLWVTRR